ncbi:TDP-N-acetylfucosamine:lipid II N-acetylfucosaminyltransferase [Iodobacter sp. LRB]|uniref:TDP-N-acetylfucosamine:lipid II N-acetylfucosaminyltransferase n=1 Tax=unclassified Iodobacter TaxID=235634 RepID=UPI000C0CC85D|nr:TDP-N-acetylfucosamine:lipid II N-acetylfucosaminyltransferase [Iodobacter sp. BJB302]PHV03477.1 hypothetical protein CSQ88_01840 [Iodobacter sp. BJB302]
MAVKILHLIHDNRVFVPFIMDVFNRNEKCTNKYIMIKDGLGGASSDGLIKADRIIDDSYVHSLEFIEDMAWCTCIIIHNMTPLGAKLVQNAAANTVIVWSGWGGDYVRFLVGDDRYFITQETNKLLRKNKLMRVKFIFSLMLQPGLFYRKLKNRFVPDNTLDKILPRINYFSAPIPQEYDLLVLALGRDRFKAKYVQLNYGSYEQAFATGPAAILEDNILVGNSAMVSNNHAEVFRLLSSLDLGDRKIIVPLSYGDFNYRDEVVKLGMKYFGNNFVPLLDFIPLSEYNKIIATCSVVIMNQRNQQALGNIGTALYSGAKVFLQSNNVVYKFFKQKSAHVFDLNRELSACMFSRLTFREIEQNRTVLKSFWGEEKVKENVSSLVELLEKTTLSTI